MHDVVIISFSPIARDPRVMRQAQALSDRYNLTVIGFGPDPADRSIKFIPVKSEVSPSLFRKIRWGLELLAGNFESFYWRLPWVIEAKRLLDQLRPDAIIANDIESLPVALSINNVPVLCDAHEYSPRQFEDRFRWRVFFRKYKDYICRIYLPRTTAMTTVCEGIRDEYYKCYGVSSKIVHNTPVWQRPRFNATNPNRINLIHHGIANKSRHLELMIDMMDHLDDRFYLDLMLVGQEPHLSALRNIARRNSRVRMIPPVSMADICNKLSGYDIGVFLLKPVNFNYTHALPNKFFEFVQAGLAVAIGPSVEMKRLVDKHRFGVVSDTFDPRALARMLNALSSDDIDILKQSSISASKVLGFETDAQIIRTEVDRIIDNRVL